MFHTSLIILSHQYCMCHHKADIVGTTRLTHPVNTHPAIVVKSMHQLRGEVCYEVRQSKQRRREILWD